MLSRSAIGGANQQRLIVAEDFQNWRRIRNGVKAFPFILRNCYHVDEMPVCGKIYGKFFFYRWLLGQKTMLLIPTSHFDTILLTTKLILEEIVGFFVVVNRWLTTVPPQTGMETTETASLESFGNDCAWSKNG